MARGAASLVVALALALTLTACGGGAKRSDHDPSSRPPAVGTPAGLLDWIRRHPSHAGLSVVSDRGRAVLSFGADRHFPLASTRKVLVVGALIASGARLSERVPRKDVERFYVPGTDSGAHERAQLDDARPTLRQLAQASLEVSDNAAADALLARVGARAVDAWTRRQGLARQDPILPVFGELAAWGRDPGWVHRSPAERARRALALARSVQPRQIRLPPEAEQRRLTAASVAGVPAEWARLMRDIGRRGEPALVTLLDWPRRKSHELAQRFDRYLTKGGSLPGVITEASYVRPAGRPGTAVALFLRDLPPDVEKTLKATFAQQKLIMRLAGDPAFLRRARAALGDG